MLSSLRRYVLSQLLEILIYRAITLSKFATALYGNRHEQD
jgi:hypothetical protein